MSEAERQRRAKYARAENIIARDRSEDEEEDENAQQRYFDRLKASYDPIKEDEMARRKERELEREKQRKLQDAADLDLMYEEHKRKEQQKGKRLVRNAKRRETKARIRQQDRNEEREEAECAYDDDSWIVPDGEEEEEEEAEGDPSFYNRIDGMRAVEVST